MRVLTNQTRTRSGSPSRRGLLAGLEGCGVEPPGGPRALGTFSHDCDRLFANFCNLLLTRRDDRSHVWPADRRRLSGARQLSNHATLLDMMMCRLSDRAARPPTSKRGDTNKTLVCKVLAWPSAAKLKSSAQRTRKHPWAKRVAEAKTRA